MESKITANLARQITKASTEYYRNLVSKIKQAAHQGDAEVEVTLITSTNVRNRLRLDGFTLIDDNNQQNTCIRWGSE